MKHLLPMTLTLTFSLLLCHCGTEVGNGVAPTESTSPEDSSKGTGIPTSAPQADNSGTETVNYVLSTSFIAACASPFAESIEGTFANTAGTTGFTVTVGNDGKKTVARWDGSTIFVVTSAPGSGTYAIEALPLSPSVSCSAVTSQTLNDGTVQRSVTLDSGAVIQWTLSAGKVISMKLTTAEMAEESWTKRP
jgi:hypothetical protein